MRGDGHDRAGAVAHEDVVGDPDRDLLIVDRIDRVRAGEDAGLAFGEIGAFEVALVGDFGFVFLDGVAVLGRGEFVDERMFRRKDHVGRAEKRVGPRGEDRNGV